MIDDSVIEAITGEEIDRLIRHRACWDIYNGDIKRPLTVEHDAPDDNVLLPVLRNAVVKSRSFLMGKPCEYPIGNLSADDNPVRYLDELRRRWEWGARMLEAATNGGVTGDCYLQFVPDPSNPMSLDHRVVVLDPSNVTPVWEPDDFTDIWCWRIRANTVNRDGKPVIRERQWVRADNRESWTWETYEAPLSIEDLDRKGRYQPTRGKRFRWRKVDGPTVWPYTWAPFFHAQNLPVPNQYWGESDITTSVENLARSLVRAASHANKTLRHYAHPKTVALGLQLDEWDTSIGRPLVSANEDGKVFNLEMQSDGTATMAFLDFLQDQLQEALRIPRVASGKFDTVGQLSGLAIKLLFGPLLELTADKQTMYGPMKRDLFQRVLEYSGLALEDQFVSVQWPDPLPADELTEAQTARAQQDAGASERTTLTRLGFDPETEFENRDEERLQNPDTFGMLQRIGEDQAPIVGADNVEA